MLDLSTSYDALRTTAGTYRRGAAIARIEGVDRARLATRLLAKSIEFAPVDSCVDSLLLDDEGAPLGLALALLRDDVIVLVVDADEAWFALAERVAADFDAEVVRDERIAVAVEGPRAWQVVEPLVTDRGIADVLLGEVLDAELDGAAVLLARTGTTAEFGYLVVGAEPIAAALAAAAADVDGGEIDPAVLDRVRVETNYPVLPAQLDGANLLEAGLGWFATLGREDEFVGAAVAETPAPERRTVAAELDGDCPAVGAEVRDGDRVIGRVLVATERAGRDAGLALLLLDDPYGVPGLELDVDGVAARTLARPTVSPASWDAQIGVN
ncbi:MAG: aminomethyl transferase family protein [Microbacteriaceae bacterium]|nr:aminomethyl transferase family protein [Microbacteriaceae bacterium]